MPTDPVMPIPEPPAELHLRGEAIVAVTTSPTESKLVIFRPTKMTIKKVEAFQHDLNVKLSIEDNNGEFVPNDPRYIVDFIFDDNINVLVVDTDRIPQ